METSHISAYCFSFLTHPEAIRLVFHYVVHLDVVFRLVSCRGGRSTLILVNPQTVVQP